jgi:hypothetical protein
VAAVSLARHEQSVSRTYFNPGGQVGQARGTTYALVDSTMVEETWEGGSLAASSRPFIRLRVLG